MNEWDPVDPLTLTAKQFIDRMTRIIAADEGGWTPDMPIPPGYFRCFICRRVFSLKQDGIEEADREFFQRHGRHAVSPVLICPTCGKITDLIKEWSDEQD